MFECIWGSPTDQQIDFEVCGDATSAIPVDFISKNNKNCHKKLDEKKCM